MAPLSLGCFILEQDSQDREEMEAKEAEREAAEQKAKKEKKEVTEDNEAEPAEEVAEEERSFPNEPITYTGKISGWPCILIVNFKTIEVTGSIEVSDFPDYIISDGKIDLDTLKITANSPGFWK